MDEEGEVMDKSVLGLGKGKWMVGSGIAIY